MRGFTIKKKNKVVLQLIKFSYIKAHVMKFEQCTINKESLKEEELTNCISIQRLHKQGQL